MTTQWFILCAGIGLIWGIYTDNMTWGIVIGAAVGLFIDIFISEKQKNE